MSEALFDTLAAGSHQLGLATLNRPEQLNCNTREMAKSLLNQLRIWQDDPLIAAVVLQSAGDKAFCAGGDLKELYQSMQLSGAQRADHTELIAKFHEVHDFFSNEYELTYLINTYTKPIICHAQGIVMGGGLGIASAADFRLITADARIAMPEVTIGLFPDVAASFFLNYVPGQGGLFLGATGAVLNASDALYASLADYVCEREDWPRLLETLQGFSWGSNPDENHDLIHALLSDQLGTSSETRSPGPLQKHRHLIDSLCGWRDCRKAWHAIAQLKYHEDPWLSEAAQKMLHGCPMSMALAYTMISRARTMSLKEAYEMDLVVAMQCAAQGEFMEGIRALLIDKDKTPNWRCKSIDGIAAEDLQRFFEWN